MSDLKDTKSWKHGKYIPMRMLDCGGVPAWGNPARHNAYTKEYRCTRCGKVHQ